MVGGVDKGVACVGGCYVICFIVYIDFVVLFLMIVNELAMCLGCLWVLVVLVMFDSLCL